MPFHASPDRRAKRRYAIHLPVTFKIMRTTRVVAAGRGEIVDMSSKGIAFTSSENCNPGDLVKIAISWPALLDGVTHLKLVVEATVVRCDLPITAAVIRRQEFHIRRKT